MAVLVFLCLGGGCALVGTDEDASRDAHAGIDSEAAERGLEWGSVNSRVSGNWGLVEGDPADVGVEGGVLTLKAGDPLTALKWGGALPALPYEIELEAMRVEGDDIFCSLTFPYKEQGASLVLGGWSGHVCGISSLDYYDAADNETTTVQAFDNGRWYRIRLRVSDARIEAWLDDDRIVDVDTEGYTIDTRMEMDPCKPLGLATWVTTGAFRGFRLRQLPP